MPPATNWNGRFEGVGNGGWSGYIWRHDMAAALKRDTKSVRRDVQKLEQAGVLLSAAHTSPQAEQLFRSLVRSTQAPLQRVNPLLHVNPHAPPVHVGVALATAAQACPQLPQLFTSAAVVVQEPAQSVGAVGGQPETHT